MGLTDARNMLVKALNTGNYEHELREVLDEKNLLAIGEVDAAFVVKLLHRAKGADYRASPHHWEAEVTVHTFTPRHEGRRWYVKAYFVDGEAGRAVFVSVH